MQITVPVTVTDTGTGEKTTVSAPASVRVPFGINTQQYGVISPDLTGITFTKSFTTTGWPNGVPSSWPGNGKYRPVPGTTTLACAEPDPQMVVAGQLDGPLEAFLQGAKPGDWWTAFQEWNDGGNPFWSRAGASVSLGLDMHAHLHDLTRRVRPDLRYGEDFGTSAVNAGQDITKYIVAGLDWYSMDGYQHGLAKTADDVYGATWAGIVSVVPGARPVITECNTTVDATGAWFTGCWSWLKARNGTLFCTWWGQGTHYLYPWPPAAAVVSALQAISDECAA